MSQQPGQFRMRVVDDATFDRSMDDRSADVNALIERRRANMQRRVAQERLLFRAIGALDISDTQANREMIDVEAERLNRLNAEETAFDPNHRRRMLPRSGLGDQKYRGVQIGQLREMSRAVYQEYVINPPRGLSLFDSVYSSPYFDEIKIRHPGNQLVTHERPERHRPPRPRGPGAEDA
tara:strand:+ start:692 stop:1228 length:537 start_codon:yes stop_codon:yes gene_type:complete